MSLEDDLIRYARQALTSRRSYDFMSNYCGDELGRLQREGLIEPGPSGDELGQLRRESLIEPACDLRKWRFTDAGLERFGTFET